MPPLLVAAFYRFAPFPDHREWQEPLLELCKQHEVCGTILLAPEGLNGTIAGPDSGIAAVLARIQQDARFESLEVKESRADSPPFQRMKVRIKKEIVTLGVPELDPVRETGTPVSPGEWNALLADPDVVVIDTRNDYEVAIGSFRGALNPELKTFREFVPWLREEFEERKNVKVAMFCTGGIRCEKSTAFLKHEGVEQVFQLQGGILKYLETVPEEESLFEGECFVFDERVSVRTGLEPGTYSQCEACGDPVSVEQRSTPVFIEGVQCAGCVSRTTPAQKARFAERHAQKQRAAASARASQDAE